jgi:hypothetical protein
MSTRSNIVVEGSDGKFRASYVHFDGYAHEETLNVHYTTNEKADALIAIGDMSSLSETPEGCSAYSGEEKKNAKEYDNWIEYLSETIKNSWIEFVYLWLRKEGEGKWFKLHISALRYPKFYEVTTKCIKED